MLRGLQDPAPQVEMAIGIESIEYYLPGHSVSSGELARTFGFPLAFVEEKIGVRRIYVAEKHETTSDLAVEAVRKIFKRRPEVREKAGLLLVCTQTPDFQLPHTAAIVQKKLGLKKSLACFDLSLGCSGFVYGLSLARSFMQDNDLEYGLLITAETYSKIIDEHDKNTKPLFSDAAAATLLGREPALVPGRFTFGTDGEKYDSLILSARNGKDSPEPRFLYMNGRRIFELAAEEIPRDVEACLKMNHLSPEAIDYFVFHQASLFMLDTLAKKLGMDGDGRVVKCIDRFGNTVSSSIPIVLKGLDDIWDRKRRRILISGFGVGLSWSSTILLSQGGE